VLVTYELEVLCLPSVGSSRNLELQLHTVPKEQGRRAKQKLSGMLIRMDRLLLDSLTSIKVLVLKAELKV